MLILIFSIQLRLRDFHTCWTNQETQGVISNYLSISNLQHSSLQLFDSRILGWNKSSILSPQNRGHWTACGHTAEDESTIYCNSLIYRTLSNDRGRPVCNHCQKKQQEIDFCNWKQFSNHLSNSSCCRLWNKLKIIKQVMKVGSPTLIIQNAFIWYTDSEY